MSVSVKTRRMAETILQSAHKTHEMPRRSRLGPSDYGRKGRVPIRHLLCPPFPADCMISSIQVHGARKRDPREARQAECRHPWQAQRSRVLGRVIATELGFLGPPPRIRGGPVTKDGDFETVQVI